ncbi:YigZ family protein [uncultured Anaerococcus sp.]|uniref:YigZ family protein n=1 Tax=uncultured Anaerococcus sp. TaxID=293428 RepID=UPI0025FC8E48|nr:YigZ family protein [uncultured Anaerococcus sp.]
MENISEAYKTIKGTIQSEFEEEKSRFITTISHIESEDDANDFIAKISEKYKDATHNCTAFIINERPVIKRYNDNGEPQGSAGLPMLLVLEKEELTNVCAVVTRYFGGKLLGKGGLVRAYGRGVSETLENNIIYKRPFFVVELTHSYELLGIIENYINEKKFQIIDKEYTDKVKISLYIREEDFEKTKSDLINLTSSKIKITNDKAVMLFSK